MKCTRYGEPIARMIWLHGQLGRVAIVRFSRADVSRAGLMGVLGSVDERLEPPELFPTRMAAARQRKAASRPMPELRRRVGWLRSSVPFGVAEMVVSHGAASYYRVWAEIKAFSGFGASFTSSEACVGW